MNTSEGLIDWFELHPTGGSWKAPVPSEKASYFLTHLWPMSLPYASPVRARFLIELEKSGLSRSSETFLVRDGLVPLLWFFKLWPEPGSFSGKLIVGERFLTHVPPAWRDRALGYRIAMAPRASAAPVRRKLLALGLAMPGYASIESVERRLAALDAPEERMAFLPVRFGCTGDVQVDFHLSFMKAVCQGLGSGLRSVNWNIVDSMDGCAGLEVLDLSDGLLLNDNYLVHTLLSKGAALAKEPETDAAPPGRFVQTSPHHGYVISEANALPYSARTDQIETMSELGKAMHAFANQLFPWPTWFEDFGKTL